MPIVYSRITSKSQTTIPRAVRDSLGVGPGDALAYTVDNGRVTLAKAAPTDAAYLRSLSGGLSEEWDSAEDGAAYDRL